MKDVKDYAILIGVFGLSFLLYIMSRGVLTPLERGGLFILSVSVGLWLAQPIPVAATALLIPILQVFFGVQELRPAIMPFSDPVILLLLGGFFLAVMVEKYGLDSLVAERIVSGIRMRARYIILVLMFTTAFLSLWISNTASTAIMLPLVIKLCDRTGEENGNFAKISVLCIAYAATAGGLGSLLGTTTPAMAVSFIDDMTDYTISFLEWTMYGLPVTVIMIFVIWVTVFRVFPTKVTELSYQATGHEEMTGRQKLGVVVFLIAVTLWVTGQIPLPLAEVIGWGGHGVSTALVSGIVAVLLFASGLLDKSDISKASWSTILLIGGSLSLGASITISGLDDRIIDVLIYYTVGLPEFLVLLVVGFIVLGVGAIASNTASAGIFLPIAIGLSRQTGIDPVIIGVLVGVTTSLDFTLPIGTPPNAMAFSTEKVDMIDMLKAGLILDIIGTVITVLLAVYLWPLIRT